MKRIIVEGMDGTGKTTLIERLMGQFHQLRLVINTLGPDQDFDTWWPTILNRNDAPYVPIHDRFFYSELVYGTVLRGYIKCRQETRWSTETTLRDQALLIYAKPPHLVLDSNPQMKGVDENVAPLLNFYDLVMKKERALYPAGRFLVYDWTEAGALSAVEKAVEKYLVEPLYVRSPDPGLAGSGG